MSICQWFDLKLGGGAAAAVVVAVAVRLSKSDQLNLGAINTYTAHMHCATST